ncbi:Uu.00g125520.m01.CDS01 [Anthostomella pinea]|uniref:Uu.00g125520.m01.CDS01 n=1 Tax=Anthostomella pinea TaxID=933095 RepID=A0AAI8YFA4_9PEZI|nr:Uu.00g125520.m01.CDS01 [Anthostomella pinea]
MRKPGDNFGFQLKNNLRSSKTPNFGKHKDNNQESRNPFEKPLQLAATGYQATETPHLILVSVTMVKEQAPPKAPLRPLGTNETNGSIYGQPSQQNEKPRGFMSANTPGFINVNPTFSSTQPTSRPAAAPTSVNPVFSAGDHTPRPAIKASGFRGGNMEDKYANLFIQPKNRPEHHRPQRINGPLQPTAKDKRPAPAPMFNTIPGAVGSASNPISVVDAPPISKYSTPGVFSEYVDPKKAAADIKALLEGAIEDEEEDGEEDGEENTMKDDEDEAKSQVEGLNVRLLPHQVEGVTWMKGRELGPVKKGKVPKGGLLADDMGLGKTLQSISLILSNPKPADKHPVVEKTTLVVAPLALIRQWEAEIKEKVTASHRLKVLVHHGPQRTKRFEDLRRYDVVITTYQILVSEHNHTTESLKAGCFGLHWYRVILDEAHTIKNRNAKASKACYELRSVYRWCLSGTPMQNNLEELQSLVRFLRIKPYDDLREWKDHFDLPMKQGKGHVAFKRLHSLLACFMKRRTKDVLKKAGALDTGGKGPKDGEKSATSSFKVTERKVVAMKAQFSPAEKRFYDRLEQRTDKSLEAMMRGKVNYASALVLLLRLRQACNHPKLVEGKLEKDKDALSEEGRPKKADTDVDALADLLGGLDVGASHCEICGWELDQENRLSGSDKCKACFEDLEYFKHHEDGGELKASKTKTKQKTTSKVKKVVRQEVETKSIVNKRKPRNRRAIIDSDDEEAEASWIVSGDEQGPLRLGKAGGTDDENAEGEGETINSDDSEEEDSQGGSRLDSFVVDDGTDTKPEDIQRALEESDSEDDLDSLSAIGSQIKQRKSQAAAARDDGEDADSESESDSESDTGISESDIDGSDSEEDTSFHAQKTKGNGAHVLASAKIRQLITLLHEEVNEHKFIVFSQFTSMLDLVEPFFRKEGIKYTRYDGSMKNDAREASLNRLRNDKHTRVLLCSLRCGALGLNLTAASRVVILEPFWNPFVEEQAIDRVHRLTQTVDVVVYKLTIEGSVEERILELQEKKRLLAQTAIETGARKEGLKLGLNEMLDLFKPVGRGRGGDPDDADNSLVGGSDVSRISTASSSRGNGKGSSAGRASQESSVYGRRW